MDPVDRRHPQAPEIDLQGQLGNFLISDIIQMIGLSGKTGTLTLIQGWNSRTITFENGRITYVASGSRLPSQFELLIRTGRLTRQQIEAFKARRPGHTDQEMLRELVERKLLHPNDLARCNELLLESAVYTLFQWRNCAFTFVAGEVVKEGGVPVTVDGNHLIIEGTRRVDEWVEISPVVPSVFMIFRPRHTLSSGPFQNTYARFTTTSTVGATWLRSPAPWGFRNLRPPGPCSSSSMAGSSSPTPEQAEDVRAVHALRRVDLYEARAVRAQQRCLDVRVGAQPLRRGARSHRPDVVRQAHPQRPSDQAQPHELIDLYKTFIGIQNNKLSRMFEPRVFQGLMEGLYRNADPEIRAMMRMYEFFEIDGIALLDMFGQTDESPKHDTKELLSPTRSRSA
jgi:hypothetical protein